MKDADAISVKVMSKGRITIPRDILTILGVKTGEHITFIVEGNTVSVVNSKVYAMQHFQNQMKEAAESAGLLSEDDVSEWITNSRRNETIKQ